MLSDRDIKRELIKAKNIAIDPLKLENINGSSINFTASKNAWRVSDGESAVCHNNKKIIIPPRETVCILTEEVLWVSRRISGTYHSRVSLSAKGLSNISTTLDPKWTGYSLISLTNSSDQNQEIDVGTGIVTLTFDYLYTPTTKDSIEIAPSRSDIYSKFSLSDEQKELLDSTEHRTPNRIKKKMLKTEAYWDLKEETWGRKIKNFFINPLVTGIVGALIGFIGSIIVAVFFK
ncbi:hypothetical protein AAHH17_17665 [Lysinibacillus capsici]|uniref:dCTP deaminase n=1 Tax=Lysinibacillus capsici TaxID=2115968 RepID=UPI0032E44D96